MRRAVWLLAVGGLAAGCGPTVTFPSTGDGGAGGAATSGGPSSGQGGTTSNSSGETTSSTGQTSSGTGGAGGGHTVSSVTISASAASTTAASSTTSGVGGGMPGCKTCGEAIQGAPGQLCMDSQPLFDALINCACVNYCPQDCWSSCNGMPGDPNCDNCIYAWCGQELSDCTNDM